VRLIIELCIVLTAAVVIGTLKAHIDRLTVEIDEIDTDIEESQALVTYLAGRFRGYRIVDQTDFATI
jgi:hypothetical protein